MFCIFGPQFNSECRVKFVHNGKIKEGAIFGMPWHPLCNSTWMYNIVSAGKVYSIPEHDIEDI